MKRFIPFLCSVIALVNILTTCSTTSEINNTTDASQIKNIYQKSDPGLDDTLNILLIGNSGCYYYVEELHGMLKAVGIRANVCNVYYSGCNLSQHWTWWKSGESHYDYFITNDNGRVKTTGANLEWCLQQQNWDILALAPGGQADLRSSAVEVSIEKRHTYLFDLYGYLREQFPYAKLYWQQPSPYQIGYSKSFTITSLEDQQKDNKVFRELSIAISNKYNVDWIPRGDAAMIVREGGYDNLCARLGKGVNHEGDYYHDGDLGGGQFLTASVWFEIITGQSCIGNTYRPNYQHNGLAFPLSEELVETLQNAAHKAVEQKSTES